MKDLSFLKREKIALKGVYDNERIFENTISAFNRAIKNRYAIELDLRLLSDGTIVCFNDANLKRLLHVDEKIEKLTYDELCYMARFQIPKFEAVLDIVRGSVPLLIELKTVSRKYLLENKVSEILENYDGLFTIQSFYIRTIKWFYKNKKDFIIGYIVGKHNYKKEHLFKKYDFLVINAFLYSDKRIRKIREEKIVLGCNIANKQDYNLKKNVFDNLLLDNILEIDSR